MDEMNAWSNFLTTGSVLDYLRYTTLRNAEKLEGTQEDENENQHGRTDYQGTEYR
ncbi:MAG TPA: hypothetical protein GX401_07620 [Clostridiales bacterium]|nr:hypothetical protein [Clostridiales bacterium]